MGFMRRSASVPTAEEQTRRQLQMELRERLTERLELDLLPTRFSDQANRENEVPVELVPAGRALAALSIEEATALHRQQLLHQPRNRSIVVRVHRAEHGRLSADER